jgi:ribosomal protein S27E
MSPALLPKRYKAVIGLRRKHHTHRYFVCTVACPGCEWSRVVSVAGWDALTCGGCGATLLKKAGR